MNEEESYSKVINKALTLAQQEWMLARVAEAELRAALKDEGERRERQNG